jgi:hypothetical protein
VSCASHAKKFWAFCSVEANDVDEGFLRKVLSDNGLLESPFFAGRRAHVPEALIIWKCLEKDRRRAKTLRVDGRVCAWACRRAATSSPRSRRPSSRQRRAATSL